MEQPSRRSPSPVQASTGARSKVRTPQAQSPATAGPEITQSPTSDDVMREAAEMHITQLIENMSYPSDLSLSQNRERSSTGSLGSSVYHTLPRQAAELQPDQPPLLTRRPAESEPLLAQVKLLM